MYTRNDCLLCSNSGYCIMYVTFLIDSKITHASRNNDILSYVPLSLVNTS